jgi:hypothetical protein
MSELTAASLLSSWIRRVSGMYANDLKALSAAAYAASPGGVARSPQSFTAEVAGMNLLLAGMLQGAAPAMPSEEQSAAYEASLATIEAGAAAVIASGTALADAVDANPAKLAEMTQAPWGEPMTFGALVNVAANHIMYHDGHLTLIQMLHGDAEMHWFE